jgi:hypothetical protein
MACHPAQDWPCLTEGTTGSIGHPRSIYLPLDAVPFFSGTIELRSLLSLGHSRMQSSTLRHPRVLFGVGTARKTQSWDQKAHVLAYAGPPSIIAGTVRTVDRCLSDWELHVRRAHCSPSPQRTASPQSLSTTSVESSLSGCLSCSSTLHHFDARLRPSTLPGPLTDFTLQCPHQLGPFTIYLSCCGAIPAVLFAWSRLSRRPFLANDAQITDINCSGRRITAESRRRPRLRTVPHTRLQSRDRTAPTLPPTVGAASLLRRPQCWPIGCP